MLHKWTKSLNFLIKSPIRTPLIFCKLSVSSAANLAVTTTTTTTVPIVPISTDPVHEILSGVRDLGFRQFVSRDYFKDLFFMLNQSQKETVMEKLSVQNADFVVDFFHLLRNEFGFQHSRVSRFLVSHVLARKRRFMDLRLVLDQMLQLEGSGSAPLLCELLLRSFNGWDSTNVVWDMLAFVYSRFEMVHDALFVIVKMKEHKLQPSIYTYNSLLHNFRHTDIMWEAYNDIKDSGTPQNAQTTSIIVDGLCRQSRFLDAVLFLQENDGKEFAPSVVSFNTIMSRYCELGFADVAKSFFCMMLKYGLRPDTYSYNILIHGLCVAGSMEEALELANDMEKQGVQPDIITYKIVAKGFHLLGLMSGAREIIQTILTDEGLRPDLVTYTILICGHCQMGNVEEALKLRREMLSSGFQLNVILYSVLLSSLCKRGQVDEALQLLYEMEANSLQPDLVTYSIVIRGLCKQGKVQQAIQLYNEMRFNRIYPNSFAHSSILKGFCEKGMISEARMYFGSLIMSNLKPDIILYNIMIDGYVKLGYVEEAVRLFKKLADKAITPTIVTFNTLIYGFCKNRRIVEARRLLDTIKQHGLEPSAVTYTTLMNAYCEEGNINNLHELLLEMNLNNIEPTHVTYTVVIKGLCKRWKLEESVQLLEDMRGKGLAPDQITYNTIIQCFCKAKDMRKAFELLDDMLLHNLEPSPVTYNLLIDGLCRYGDVKGADHVLVSLQERNINLTKVAYTTIIKAHCVKGDAHRAVDVFHQMVEKGFEVSINDYSAVVNRFCKRCLTSEAKYFFSIMLSYGVSPDQEIFEMMLNALHRAGHVHSVFELLAVMIKFGFPSLLLFKILTESSLLAMSQYERVEKVTASSRFTKESKSQKEIYVLLFSICDNAKNTKLVPALYIFGDSTVDAGNNNNLSTKAKANSLPYGIDFNRTTNGRFTNGMIVPDYFARFLGLPFAPPYMNLSGVERHKTTTGLNFASASCGILPETRPLKGSCLTLDDQTELFKRTAKTLEVQNIQMHLAKSIFIISVGSNDYIMNYLNTASKTKKLFSPDYFAKFLSDELVKRLKRLYLIGARKFMVSGLGPLGCIPAIARSTPHEGDCVESINQAVLSYNKELSMKLQKLQSQLHGSFFIHSDTFKFLQELKENKEKYGITDTQNACWDGEHDPCPVRDRYIYFDSIHPSQITNSIYASRCFNESSICTPMNIMRLVLA
ncbi:unnamed protein product [Dovyalis caffra]|uniref:Pentatricopeptide repeat-containing protein n=1 Tax=Dovyalis caffra TaxID=77055 RepID=A0AAV1QXF9_9ROSI|nr:unnamed protein product [Dovyalis caffra]